VREDLSLQGFAGGSIDIFLQLGRREARSGAECIETDLRRIGLARAPQLGPRELGSSSENFIFAKIVGRIDYGVVRRHHAALR
jgi:hypothetical protein